MQQFTTTESFIYKGQSLPGVPLLVDKNERPLSVFTNYMMYLVLEKGATNRPNTWKSHCDALCDYFSYLEANGLDWGEKPIRTPAGKEASNLSLYQRWSKDIYRKPNGNKLEHSTINLRISKIEAFYRWARAISGLIDWVPYTIKLKAAPQRHPDAMAHTHGQRYVESSESRLPIQSKPVKMLSVDQCRELLSAPMSETIKLLTRLMLSTGLRNSEIRTFPRKYLFDPRERGLDPRRRIRVDMSPRDMEIKREKPRTVYTSYQLMLDMYLYMTTGEGAERATRHEDKTGERPPMIFLNHLGNPFGRTGLNNAYKKLYPGVKVGNKHCPPVISVHVTPHMLRHTFATLELYAESEALDKHGRKRGLGHGLAWVRDRLGHSSIQSTTIYVHCLHQLETPELNEYQQDLDDMFWGDRDGD